MGLYQHYVTNDIIPRNPHRPTAQPHPVPLIRCSLAGARANGLRGCVGAGFGDLGASGRVGEHSPSRGKIGVDPSKNGGLTKKYRGFIQE